MRPVDRYALRVVGARPRTPFEAPRIAPMDGLRRACPQPVTVVAS